jgi:hypothetical protein
MTKNYPTRCLLVREELTSRKVTTVVRDTRVEAESNTFTVTLRVVGGDEKGSLESETVQYSHESYGTQTR